MKYLMLIYGNEQVWNSVDAETFAELVGEVDAFHVELRESGEFVEAQGLVERPRSVRVAGGEPVVTDGPYLEAKEYLGGYYLVECESRERALELAGMIPDAKVDGLGIEVRPVVFSGDPAELETS